MPNLIAALILLLSLFLLAAVRTAPSFRSNCYLIGFSLFLSFAVLECLATKLLVRSDSFGFTLSARAWNKKYWHPLNSNGYRDHEWSKRDGEKLILFVGDSFVAGTGIDDITDRFAEKTGKILGASWRSIVLAKRGWGPIEETKALSSFPNRSEVIVLSHFINDIEDAMPKCNKVVSCEIEDLPSPITALFIDNSYALNFLYWRWWRWNRSDWGAGYWKSVSDATSDSNCLEHHWKQLEILIQLAKEKANKVILVAFPDLAAVGTTASFTKRVVAFAEEQGIAGIDLAPEARKWPLTKLIVNSLDSHPSKEFHARVAQLIADNIGHAQSDETH